MTRRREPEEGKGSPPDRERNRARRFPCGGWLNGIRGIHLFWAFVASLSLGFLWSAFSGPRGIFTLLEFEERAHRMNEENRALRERNQAIQKEIYLLRTSPSYMQRVAREELGYIAEGETIYLPAETPRVLEPGISLDFFPPTHYK